MLGNNPISSAPISSLGDSGANTLSVTLESISTNISASVYTPQNLTATLAATLGDIGVSMTETNGHTATMAVTLDSISTNINATVYTPQHITGTLAATLDSISVNMYATESPIYVVDTHDGDYYKKKFAKEIADNSRRRKQVVDLYEELVELKPKAAIDAVAPFIENDVNSQNSIDFNALLADLNRTEAVYNSLKRELEEIDDEDVLLLL
jgi:hypothetical protein